MPVNNWCRTIFKGCCWLREKSFERKKRFVNFSNIQPTWFLSCFKVPCLEGKESMAMKELFKVLKDHSNPFMQELVTASYQQCFISEVESILQDSEEVDVHECGTENVVRLRLVHPAFQASLTQAITKMQSAKLTIDRFGLDSSTPEAQSESAGPVREPGLGDKTTVLINDIAIAMRRLHYALYRGKIYKKCEGAKYCYSHKCDVKAFVNSLAANESFKPRLIRDMKTVIGLLSDPDCEVIRPITVDYNLIEVNQGYCWSVAERKFLKDPIPAEKVGIITPRAFSNYDPFKAPNPKYFKEILENSLPETQIALFCEDFLRLLKFNQKKHKERVPCLVGGPDSGKTSLFYPILGIINHNSVATITKQKVFSKAMISKETELIFIDEASPSMLDVDDWKILTQGGYTACDVKYKTARSFFNRCPMFMTAQTKLKFKPDDQKAMDRRIRYYLFKSLPNPKKKAAQWLRKHPVECIAGAASKARVASDEESSSEDTDEETVDDSQHDDGTLPESEKEVLRSLQLHNHLTESSEMRNSFTESSSDHCDEHLTEQSDQDNSTVVLRTALGQSSPSSLRHRQLSRILENRIREKERLKKQDEWRYRGRMEQLISRGVSSGHAALLPRDPAEPLPTPIREDLAVIEERRGQEQLEKRKARAKEVFESQWLQNTEKELQECMEALRSSLDQETRASMEALREVIEDKLANHHRNLGTLRCQEALTERKRVCKALGLLRKEDEDLVASLTEPLPVASVRSTFGVQEEGIFVTPKTPSYVPHQEAEQYTPQSPFMFSSPTEDPPSEVDSENEERLFVTPHPSGAQLTTGRTHSTKRRRGRSYSQSTPTTKRRNTLFNYYATQQ